jgi:hypothetical protein
MSVVKLVGSTKRCRVSREDCGWWLDFVDVRLNSVPFGLSPADPQFHVRAWLRRASRVFGVFDARCLLIQSSTFHHHTIFVAPKIGHICSP